ncbi:hypothetical protein D3C72_1619800 [compost metagenome]
MGIGAIGINPQMEPRCRISHPSAAEGIQVLVDFYEVGFGGFVKTQTEAQGPVGAWALRACTDLASQASFLPGHGQDAASIGQRLLQRALARLEMGTHLLRCAFVEVFL